MSLGEERIIEVSNLTFLGINLSLSSIIDIFCDRTNVILFFLDIDFKFGEIREIFFEITLTGVELGDDFLFYEFDIIIGSKSSLLILERVELGISSIALSVHVGFDRLKVG